MNIAVEGLLEPYALGHLFSIQCRSMKLRLSIYLTFAIALLLFWSACQSPTPAPTTPSVKEEEALFQPPDTSTSPHDAFGDQSELSGGE